MLFYSRNCNMCRNLFLLLKSENMLGLFKLICVDGILNKIPPSITKVPTLIMSNMTKPLIAEEIFVWIQATKTFKNKKVGDKFDTFIDTNNITNTYTHVIKEKDNELLYDLTQGTNDFIFTPPEKNKIDSKTQNKIIEEAKSKRSEQTSFFSKVFQNEHQTAVKNYEDEIKNVRHRTK